MADQLKGKRVAALATHGFEQDELLRPRKALEDAGAKVDIVSPERGEFLEHLAVECRNVIRLSRRHNSAVDDDLLVDLLRARVGGPQQLVLFKPVHGERGYALHFQLISNGYLR